MIRLSLILGLLAGSASVAAIAKDNKDIPIMFDVVVSSERFDESKTMTSADGTLSEIELSMPYAVQLDGDVPPKIQSKIAGGPNSPLSTGKVLFSSALNQNIYCGPAWSRSLGKAGPCLIDTDDDGRFDTAAKAGAMAARPAGMGMSNNFLFGINFGKRISLPSPIPYHRVDRSLAPKAKGRLLWQSNFKAGAAGPVTITFQYDARNDWAGTGLVSNDVEITFTGTPVTADLNGIKVTVLGFGPKGELVYHIGGALAATPMDFRFVDRVPAAPIFIYIP